MSAVVSAILNAVIGHQIHFHYTFSRRFYPKRLTIAIGLCVRGHTPLEQLGVKCLAHGHIGVSQRIQIQVLTPKACVLSTAPSPPHLRPSGSEQKCGSNMYFSEPEGHKWTYSLLAPNITHIFVSGVYCFVA